MKKVFNKIKHFAKNNILGFILGVALVGGITLVNADYKFTATKVYYDKSSSNTSTNKTNVGESLDELYSRSVYGNAAAADIKASKTALIGGKPVTGTREEGLLFNAYFSIAFGANESSGTFYVNNNNTDDIRRGEIEKTSLFDSILTDNLHQGRLIVKKAGQFLFIITSARHLSSTGSNSTSADVGVAHWRGWTRLGGLNVLAEDCVYTDSAKTQNYNCTRTWVTTANVDDEFTIGVSRTNTNAIPSGSISIVYLGS